jgi:DNA integrity scanning protein DisA with diadenylate cyclase activity
MEILEGLQAGLSHFSGASRTAVIFALNPKDPVFICDPQNLLEGHEIKLKELYLENEQWRRAVAIRIYRNEIGHMIPEENLQLAGLISFGGRTRSVFYQMWFTEHHPDMCSIGPTERWLEHAAWRFSNDREFYTGISGSFIREYTTHAVRDHIVDEMNLQLGWDTTIRVYPILDAVLGISKTREEGAWPRGELSFVENRVIEKMELPIRFPKSEQPRLENFKHVRKLLLAVERSSRKLISDGVNIIGIANANHTAFSINVHFMGNHGFLSINKKRVCSFADGAFHSITHRAKLVQLEEALLESNLDSGQISALFKIIVSIVHKSETEKHGSTLVVDLNPKPIEIAGQKLQQPLNLMRASLLSLAQSLSKLDGAIHIGSDLHLHGFACLLDGKAISGEDRSRGARYNSALRFTAANKNIIVVVVSSDRPVSVFQEGVELNAQCQYHPLSSQSFIPHKLANWVVATE